MKSQEKDYVLCKINKDWADEFYCQAFAVMPKAMWDAKVSEAREVGTWEVNFGTNEGWEEITFEDWQNEVEVKPITKDQATSIIDLLKIYKEHGSVALYGTGAEYIYPNFDNYFDEDEEEEE